MNETTWEFLPEGPSARVDYSFKWAADKWCDVDHIQVVRDGEKCFEDAFVRRIGGTEAPTLMHGDTLTVTIESNLELATKIERYA